MLKKIYRLTAKEILMCKNVDNIVFSNDYFSVYSCSINKFGIALPKKLFGNRSAVTRNRYRREFYFIIQKNNLQEADRGYFFVLRKNADIEAFGRELELVLSNF